MRYYEFIKMKDISTMSEYGNIYAVILHLKTRVYDYDFFFNF